MDISFLLPRVAIEISSCIYLLYVICSVAIVEILGYYLWQTIVIYRCLIF